MNRETVDQWLKDIRAGITTRPDRGVPNPELLPGYFNHLLTEVSYAADETCRCYPYGVSPDSYEGPQRDCPVHGEPAYWAASLLQDLWHRAKAGVPFGEPPEQPWERTLSDVDGDLG